MGRGRPRKLTHKGQAEEILHGISTSSNGGKTHQAPLTEIQLNTPEGMAVEISDMDKGKQGREDEWPKLTHQRGSGGGTQKNPVEVNRTVNWGKNMGNAQRKLNLLEVTPEKPWANLFFTNRLAGRGMNLNYIAPIIVEGEKVVEIMPEDVAEDDMKWAPSVVVYAVGVIPSIGAMEWFIIEQGPFSTKPVVLYHSDGYFVVRFANEEERDKWKPIFCQKYLQVGHSCVDKPKVNPVNRGQGQGQRKEWRQTIIGDKKQEKKIEQQSKPIPEMGEQNEKQGPKEQENWQIVRYMSSSKRVTLQSIWNDNNEQGKRYMFETGQHSEEIEEVGIEPEPPNKIC
ncbi:hypothetical protein R3W88_016691 [Solanum pinnatisectum]|uniref:DUF4283 domain-containing protein n=1 Tax=Solanum pinnatisectum TaxID=50273 RepID=A0AAV9KYV3_9SOLN|nr:hypothetical protein R3W88_016691 [Solanum pinnatisectum]